MRSRAKGANYLTKFGTKQEYAADAEVEKKRSQERRRRIDSKAKPTNNEVIATDRDRSIARVKSVGVGSMGISNNSVIKPSNEEAEPISVGRVTQFKKWDDIPAKVNPMEGFWADSQPSYTDENSHNHNHVKRDYFNEDDNEENYWAQPSPHGGNSVESNFIKQQQTPRVTVYGGDDSTNDGWNDNNGQIRMHQQQQQHMRQIPPVQYRAMQPMQPQLDIKNQMRNHNRGDVAPMVQPETNMQYMHQNNNNMMYNQQMIGGYGHPDMHSYQQVQSTPFQNNNNIGAVRMSNPGSIQSMIPSQHAMRPMRQMQPVEAMHDQMRHLQQFTPSDNAFVETPVVQPPRGVSVPPLDIKQPTESIMHRGARSPRSNREYSPMRPAEQPPHSSARSHGGKSPQKAQAAHKALPAFPADMNKNHHSARSRDASAQNTDRTINVNLNRGDEYDSDEGEDYDDYDKGNVSYSMDESSFGYDGRDDRYSMPTLNININTKSQQKSPKKLFKHKKEVPSAAAPTDILEFNSHAPPLPFDSMTVGSGYSSKYKDDVPEDKKLFYSKQPRQVEYKPYTLKDYKNIKKDEYVELTGKLKPDLNTDVLKAKRANKERVKEFSRNLKQYNKQEIQAHRKLPQNSEVIEAEKAERKHASKREKMAEYGKRIPKPKGPKALDSQSRALGAESRTKGRQDAQNNNDWPDRDDDFNDEGYLQGPDPTGMDYVASNNITELEAKHNESRAQIDAIKRALRL